MSILSKEQLLEYWDFPWPLMDVLIGGKSSIDLPDLRVTSMKDARDFIHSYGYDLNKIDDLKFIHATIIESLHIIESQLMRVEWRKRGIKPPEEILKCKDVCKLLLWASNLEKENAWMKAWACAVLRVMHTISHIEGVGRMADINLVRDQIMGGFEKALFRNQNGALMFGEGLHSIPLERMDWKLKKSRNSIILKLLHKPANVAETIYDLLGVRIITKSKVEAMLAVKYLRQYFLVTFANTNPTRARNTLIDLESFKEQVKLMCSQLEKDKISPEEFSRRIEETYWHCPKGKRNRNNLHSADAYRSIQLTCRQLIKYRNPNLAFLKKVRDISASLDAKERNLIQDFAKWASGWNGNYGRQEMKVFYPFEVQIFDIETWEEMQKGDAAHHHYKKSQISAARRRVLSEVLKLARKGVRSNSEKVAS